MRKKQVGANEFRTKFLPTFIVIALVGGGILAALAILKWLLGLELIEILSGGEAYITLLSIVFIVTSIVTVLSDKSDTIYWLGVMENKLKNPPILNLVSLFSSLMAIILVATIALFILPEFVEYCLFSVVIIVAIISGRMLDGFFCRDSNKELLREEFLEGKKIVDWASYTESAIKCVEKDDMAYAIRFIDYILANQDSVGKKNKKLVAKYTKLLAKTKDDLMQIPERRNFMTEYTQIIDDIFTKDYADMRELENDEAEKEFWEAHSREKEALESYREKKKQSEYGIRKQAALSNLGKALQMLVPKRDKWLHEKDQLIAYTFEYLQRGDINHPLENIKLLRDAGRVANVRELLSYAAYCNVNVYLHLIEQMDGRNASIDFDNSCYGHISRERLNCAITEGRDVEICSYFFRKMVRFAYEVSEEYQTVVQEYTDDMDARIEIRSRLKLVNEKFYKSLVPVNEALKCALWAENSALFCSFLEELKRNRLVTWSLFARDCKLFFGEVDDKQYEVLCFDAKVKEMSWFLPDYLVEFEEELKQQLKKGILSERDARKIELASVEYYGEKEDETVQRIHILD